MAVEEFDLMSATFVLSTLAGATFSPFRAAAPPPPPSAAAAPPPPPATASDRRAARRASSQPIESHY